MVFAQENVNVIEEYEFEGVSYRIVLLEDSKDTRIVQTESSNGDIQRAVYDKLNNNLKILQSNENTSFSTDYTTQKDKFEVIVDINIPSENKVIVNPSSIYDELEYVPGVFFTNYKYRREYYHTSPGWSEAIYSLTTPTNYVSRSSIVPTSNSTHEKIRSNSESFKTNLKKADDYSVEAAKQVIGAISPLSNIAFLAADIVETARTIYLNQDYSTVGTLVLSGLIAAYGPVGSAAATASYGSLAAASMYNVNTNFNNVKNP